MALEQQTTFLVGSGKPFFFFFGKFSLILNVLSAAYESFKSEVCVRMCMCISIKASLYQLLTVNHTQLHAVTPKAAAADLRAVIRKHLRYLQQSLRVVIPSGRIFLGRTPFFLTG